MGFNQGPPYVLKFKLVGTQEDYKFGVFRPIPPIEEGIGLLVHALPRCPYFDTPEELGTQIGKYPEYYHGLQTIRPDTIPSPGRFADIKDHCNPSLNNVCDVEFSALEPTELQTLEAAIQKEKPWINLEFLKQY